MTKTFDPIRHCLQPEWPAPMRVRAFCTTRHGGVSVAPYASLNLGRHVADDPAAVAENRSRVRGVLPAEPLWLNQVHGIEVIRAESLGPGTSVGDAPTADAAYSRQPATVCVVMTADCLPLLLCDRAGSVVGAAHCGWRSLAGGVIEATLTAMARPGAEVLAWLGPAIGPQAFEVGEEVRQAFITHDAAAAAAFRPGAPGKYWADIYLLARQHLAAWGVTAIYGGDRCTYSEAEDFFSYRRDGVTGRMGSFIWLDT